MAAEAEGAVDDDRTRLGQGRGQHVQASLEHHRDVSLAQSRPLKDPAQRRAYVPDPRSPEVKGTNCWRRGRGVSRPVGGRRPSRTCAAHAGKRRSGKECFPEAWDSVKGETVCHGSHFAPL
ncbi:hypothetical protein GCM10010388_10820 [Streptomyces mauvecolor]